MALMQTQTQLLSSSLTSTNSNRIHFFSPITRSEKASDSDSTPTSPKGKGFGSSSRKEKQKREWASIIRRSPLEKPAAAFLSEQGRSKEQNKNENAFILTWLGFGAIILVEGIALAASGFLPEEWDKLLVKYLYPSFTPTVF